jgi:Phage integrase family
VEGLRFHDLRHSAATLALAARANTRELMERMGHTSPQVALRYQHVMAGRDQAIAAALDALVQAAAIMPPRGTVEGTRDLPRVAAALPSQAVIGWDGHGLSCGRILHRLRGSRVTPQVNPMGTGTFFRTRHPLPYSSWRRSQSCQPSPSSRPLGIRSRIG